MQWVRRCLSKLPAWSLSIITLLAILWLTLAPKPLGDEPPVMFPGADKIVHAVMFGFLAAMMILDWQRRHNWRNAGWARVLTAGFISALTGVVIEFMQETSGYGRSFEFGDILADTSGAFICAVTWKLATYKSA